MRAFVMDFLKEKLDNFLHKNPNVPEIIEKKIKQSEKEYDQTLVVALNYGARLEIAEAAKKIAEKAASGVLDPSTVTEDILFHQ